MSYKKNHLLSIKFYRNILQNKKTMIKIVFKIELKHEYLKEIRILNLLMKRQNNHFIESISNNKFCHNDCKR